MTQFMQFRLLLQWFIVISLVGGAACYGLAWLIDRSHTRDQNALRDIFKDK